MSRYTRQQVIDAALALRGVPFLHQGRNPETGLDCVGLLVEIGKRIGYGSIYDVTTYRRVPSAATIRETLNLNCDEIPLAEVGKGDFYLMRLFGRKPRHVAICMGDGGILHASYSGVRVDPITNYPNEWLTTGFRIRGLVGG